MIAAARSCSDYSAADLVAYILAVPSAGVHLRIVKQHPLAEGKLSRSVLAFRS